MSNEQLLKLFSEFWHVRWPHQTRDEKKLEMSAHYIGCREAFFEGARATADADKAYILDLERQVDRLENRLEEEGLA